MKLRDVLLVPVVLALCACTTPSDRPSDAVRNELTPTGKLRFGVVAGAERTEFFVVKGADGQPDGVTVDLARELGRRLATPVEFVVASSSGQLTEMLTAGKLDAAIMPPDEERRKILDFGTFYFVDENTYMVPGGSNRSARPTRARRAHPRGLFQSDRDRDRGPEESPQCAVLRHGVHRRRQGIGSRPACFRQRGAQRQ